MEDIRHALTTYFHHDSFQEGQEEIIRDVLAGKDVLGVLPTGSGKSLCYQLPAVILRGLTIVISPLISLMIDQVRQIKAYHFKEVAALHSFQSMRERKYILSHLQEFKLLYLSPELLQQPEVMRALQQIHIDLFCIDEAHCISQWGYDFRPDYLRLHQMVLSLGTPPVLALTGTATNQIQNDITTHLQSPQMAKHIYSMEKRNMTFVIDKLNSTVFEKNEKLLWYVTRLQKPVLIYFSSRSKAEQMAAYLSQHENIGQVAYYHAGMQAEDRLKVQEQFMYDQLDIICCTSAFGMGINKSNIRTIIHYHPPTQIESFLQEVGRAGRDGAPCLSVLLYREQDIHVPLSIIEQELPERQELEGVFRRLEDFYLSGKALPKGTEALATLFELPETKWRLLAYQLQTLDILTSNYEIQYFETQKWYNALTSMDAFFQKRRTYKMKKAQEMLHWIDATSCLRSNLYRIFEEELTAKSTNCCSICGWDIQDFEERQRSENHSNEKDWQHMLKSLLLYEDMKYVQTK